MVTIRFIFSPEWKSSRTAGRCDGTGVHCICPFVVYSAGTSNANPAAIFPVVSFSPRLPGGAAGAHSSRNFRSSIERLSIAPSITESKISRFFSCSSRIFSSIELRTTSLSVLTGLVCPMRWVRSAA